MTHIALRFALFAALFALPACGSGHHGDPDPVFYDRLASLEIEVYDPVTGFIWQNVGVRIVRVEHEWSGCVCENPIENDWFFTDEFGVVAYDPRDLGETNVGFLLDASGRALMSPNVLEDEAVLLIEVYAPGLGSVLHEVDISWDEPTVYVQLPY